MYNTLSRGWSFGVVAGIWLYEGTNNDVWHCHQLSNIRSLFGSRVRVLLEACSTARFVLRAMAPVIMLAKVAAAKAKAKSGAYTPPRAKSAPTVVSTPPVPIVVSPPVAAMSPRQQPMPHVVLPPSTAQVVLPPSADRSRSSSASAGQIAQVEILTVGAADARSRHHDVRDAAQRVARSKAGMAASMTPTQPSVPPTEAQRWLQAAQQDHEGWVFTGQHGHEPAPVHVPKASTASSSADADGSSKGTGRGKGKKGTGKVGKNGGKAAGQRG